MAVQMERRIQCAQHAGGDHNGLIGGHDIEKQGGKLIASKSADQIPGSLARTQPLGDGTEQIVTDSQARR